MCIHLVLLYRKPVYSRISRSFKCSDHVQETNCHIVRQLLLGGVFFPLITLCRKVTIGWYVAHRDIDGSRFALLKDNFFECLDVDASVSRNFLQISALKEHHLQFKKIKLKVKTFWLVSLLSGRIISSIKFFWIRSLHWGQFS